MPALLLVQLCLPFSGPIYFSTYLSTDEAEHTGLVCAHTADDADHDSQDDHKLITHCHELDAPCDTASGPSFDRFPVISALIASYDGAVLPGCGARIYIPPKNRV